MIQLKLRDYINRISSLSNLDRWNTKRRIHHESVAEHSFHTAAIVLKLADIYTFAISSSIQLALIHDLSESEISDIPHNVKEANPEIDKVCDELEYKFLKKNLNEEYSDLMREFNEKSTTEGLIVNLADAICVYNYCMIEIDLGNKSEQFEMILNSCVDRIRRITDKLDKFKKPDSENVNFEKIWINPEFNVLIK